MLPLCCQKAALSPSFLKRGIFVIQTLLANYYAVYWPWLAVCCVVNGALLFYVKNHLKKKTLSLPFSSPASSCAIDCRDQQRVLIIAILFMAWKTLWLGRENIDIMETGNFGLSSWVSIDNFVRSAHQPLYHLLLNMLFRLFSLQPHISEELIVISRFISVLFGGLITVLLYRFSFLVLNNRLAAYTGIVLLNIHALFSFYARRIESYIVLSFFILLSYHFFWKTFIIGQEKKIWKYCVVTILCFFVHYVTLPVLLSQLFTMVVLKLRKHSPAMHLFWNFIRALLVFAFAFILYWPFPYLSFFKIPYFFSDSWINNFFLEKEYIAAVIYSDIRLVLGVPPSFFLSFFVYGFIILVLLKLKKENFPFFLLVMSMMLFCVVYGAAILLSALSSIGKFYFNPRYFIWFVPFSVLMVSSGISILREKNNFYKQTLACVSFVSIFIFNFYITNKVLSENLTPAYKKAAYYITSNIKEEDCVVWPNGGLTRLIKFYLQMGKPGEFSPHRYGSRNLEELMQCGMSYKRIWLIVPWEDFFGMPHASEKMLKQYLGFAKENFVLKSHWRGNKIDVYLFTVNKDKN